MVDASFSKRLRKWRGKRYQKEAAAALNVELQTYRNWEYGRNVPVHLALREVERILDGKNASQ